MDLKYGYCITGLIWLIAAFLNLRRARDKAFSSDGTKFHTIAILNLFAGAIFLAVGIARLLKH